MATEDEDATGAEEQELGDGAQPSSQDDAQPQDRGPRPFDIAYAREGELDALPTMKLIDDRTATLFAQELGHAFQASIEVGVKETKIERWSEFADGLERPGCFSLVSMEALGGHGMIAIQQELFFRLLELLFGGNERIGRFGVDSRKRFSSIEERVIRRIVHLFGRSMEIAWRPVIPMNVAHLRIETKPENAPISDRDDWLVITTYDVKLPTFEGAFEVALPKGGLMRFRERLSTGTYEKRPEHKENWSSALTAALRRVDVDVHVELGTAELTLKELLGLAPGQVLRLDSSPDHALTVRVSDVPKYRGRATVHHGNLAVTLEQLIP
ncbi:MAG: FliM/FliN family flagellar motor switch protein [Myxococcota bacterium]